MLVRTQQGFLASIIVLGLLMPVLAQVHGVPASVSSFGFGGSQSFAPGVPASVTSLGPYGYANSRFFHGNFGNFNAQYPRPTNFNSQFPVFDQFPSTLIPPPPTFHDFGRFHELRNRGLFTGSYFPVQYYPTQYGGGYYPPVIIVQGGDGIADGNYYEDEDGNVLVASATDRHEKRREPKEVKEVVVTPAPAAPEPTGEPLDVSPQPKTVLVYKDGHKAQVQNYAIVGDALIDLSEGRTRKIPLDNLDLIATQKANDDEGIDFRVPVKPKKH